MTTTTHEPITAMDRCDRCAAQAYVRYDLNGFDLLLCVHHNREHGDALLAKGARVLEDNTVDLLNEEGGATSAANDGATS